MTGDSAYFDEMYQPDGGVRPAYSGYCDWFDGQDNGLMRRKHAEAETNFRKTGITFNVYGDGEAEERLIDPRGAADTALMRFSLLQRALRRRLLDERQPLRLNRKDPVGKGMDFADLDAMAEILWGATAP